MGFLEGLAPQRQRLLASLCGLVELPQLLMIQDDPVQHVSRFRRDGASVSQLLSERDSQFGDYRERGNG